MCVTGVDKLKSSETFRNLILILLKLRMTKEQRAVIFKNNFYSCTHGFRVFSQIYEKIM